MQSVLNTPVRARVDVIVLAHARVGTPLISAIARDTRASLLGVTIARK